MKFTKDIRLRLNEFDGEGEVLTSDRWDSLHPMLRADLLKDWIYDLTELYSDAWQEMGGEAVCIEFVKVSDIEEPAEAIKILAEAFEERFH